MFDLGNFCLAGAWLLAIYGAAAGAFAARCGKNELVASSRQAVLFTAAFLAAALAALGADFLQHNYRLIYVWQHSNNEMAPHYLISAVWGGMDGSMLLWAAMGAGFAAAALLRSQALAPQRLAAWMPPVFSASNLFFASVVLFMTNPFRRVPDGVFPADGNGLNPLLQNPSMLIHPPLLYAGFTGFVVPFAFCAAALLSGELSSRWVKLTRRWTLLAWGFLTAGIILGGNWAYIELGWGGFWAWDPVENASFLPWLTATAFLHSVMVQERRGMLKVWNASLCLLTYVLAVFGTFLTRSGIVQSVHAFAETDFGWVFLLYIGLISLTLVSLIVVRWKALRPEAEFETYLSREGIFLFNNLLLLAICFATLWGVMFPVISEALTGEKNVVGPPFFNQVNGPLFLLLIFLMGVGPVTAWRRSSVQQLQKMLALPFAFGLMLAGAVQFLGSDIKASLTFGIALFVAITIVQEFARAVQVRRQVAPQTVWASVMGLLAKKPRRYGGLLVHLGVVVMALSIAASMLFKIERDVSVAVGESFEAGRFRMSVIDVKQQEEKNYSSLIATVSIVDRASGEELSVLRPERRFYRRNEESTTEVDIRMTPREDLYLALASLEPGRDGKQMVTLKVFINPLQVWLWFGGLIVLVGTGIVLRKGPAAEETAVGRTEHLVSHALRAEETSA